MIKDTQLAHRFAQHRFGLIENLVEVSWEVSDIPPRLPRAFRSLVARDQVLWTISAVIFGAAISMWLMEPKNPALFASIFIPGFIGLLFVGNKAGYWYYRRTIKRTFQKLFEEYPDSLRLDQTKRVKAVSRWFEPIGCMSLNERSVVVVLTATLPEPIFLLDRQETTHGG